MRRGIVSVGVSGRDAVEAATSDWRFESMTVWEEEEIIRPYQRDMDPSSDGGASERMLERPKLSFAGRSRTA